MTIFGFWKVITGKVEFPICVRAEDFEGLYHLFSSPVTYAGEIEHRIQEFTATHLLVGGGWHPDLMLWAAADYLLEKQELHSLTKIEESELQRLQKQYPQLVS
ncbi:hypothetical protein H4F17_18135 [Vibrio cholerae]